MPPDRAWSLGQSASASASDTRLSPAGENPARRRKSLPIYDRLIRRAVAGRNVHAALPRSAPLVNDLRNNEDPNVDQAFFVVVVTPHEIDVETNDLCSCLMQV